MNMQQVLAQTEEARALMEEQNKMEEEKKKALEKQKYEEKTNRILDTIASRATYLVETSKFTPSWMKKEAAQLDADIHSFIKNGEGQPLIEFIDNGCGVFFGKKNSPDAIATKKYGTYTLSLENGEEGEKFPKKIIINIQAHYRLSKMLERRLNIQTPYLLGVNEILESEMFGKLCVQFVPVSQIPKNAEVALLGIAITLVGNREFKDAAIGYPVGGNKILVTRTDWDYSAPKNRDFEFLLRYVTPQ